ncbi:MAG: GAF domain-containing protein, partial [Anaerolineae bacterium]|nr:GAF domain-containing protein [Anaerolineae bacterium]
MESRNYRVIALAALAGLLALVVLFLAINQPVMVLVVFFLLVGLGVWWQAWERAGLSRRMAVLERESADLRALTAVSRAVRSSLDVGDLFTTVYLQVVQQLKVRYFYVALLDPEHQGMLRFPLAIEERRPVEHPPHPAGGSLIGRVIETRAALLIESDVQRRAAALGLESPDPDVTSWMGAPVWSGVPLSSDCPLGCIVVEARHGRQFDAHDLDALAAIAGQAGAALHNIRRYARTDRALEQRVNQLAALERVGREMTSTLDIERIFELVLDGAMAVTASRVGALVQRSDEAPGMMEVMAARGYPESGHNVRQWEMIPQGGITGQVLQTGEAVVLDDVTGHASYLAANPATRAQVSVPICDGAMVSGVITLESEQPGAYPPETVSFLTQLANQAAIALRNAGLFEDVRATRDRLQSVLDSTHEGMLMIDWEGQVVLANPQIEALTGLPRVQWAAQPLTRLSQLALDVHARLGFAKPDILLDLLNGLQTGRLPDFETARYAYAGRHLERTIAPVRDGLDGLIGLLLVLRDVTETVKLDEARQALSSMIVHDLRSPLAAVQGSINMIADLAPDAGAVSGLIARTAGHSIRAVRRLLDMIESLLDISRMEHDRLPLDCEPTDLATVVEEVFNDLGPLARELEVEMVFEAPSPAPLLNIDPDKVRRALLNLVDNALKFTPG